MSRRTGLKLTGAAGLAALIGQPHLGSVGAQSAPPAPEGFDKTLVYMMNGVYDPNDTSTVPDGDTFLREIMGYTDEEVASELDRAEAFFRDRFGLDFSEAEAVDGMKTVEGAMLDTRGFMVDPRSEYRAYIISDESVPAEGWVVRDGGWMASIQEDGATLRGEWGGEDGTEVPGGSFLVFGEYNIDTGGEPIVIHYESGSPILPMGVDGIMAFSCDLLHEEWGEGRANGTVLAPEDLGDGTVKQSTRNVLTFLPR
ncbi:MAG: hypothetical protein M3490_00980 [Chloroflexota bacterium]|nr:hypothetical protein [Chloroflexota bacterium]